MRLAKMAGLHVLAATVALCAVGCAGNRTPAHYAPFVPHHGNGAVPHAGPAFATLALPSLDEPEPAATPNPYDVMRRQWEADDQRALIEDTAARLDDIENRNPGL